MEVYIRLTELGDLLRKLRGDLSLREAARRSGLSYSYISSLESGKHPRTGIPIKPSPDSIKNLAKAYHYDAIELMKMAGHIETSNESNIGDNTEDPLLTEIRNMSDKQKEKLRRVIDIMKEE